MGKSQRPKQQRAGTRRERISLDQDWRFALGHAADVARDFNFARSRSLVKAGEERGAGSPSFDDSSWRIVDLPHDWAIELPLDRKGGKELCEHGFRAVGPDHPQNSVGWYRKSFEIPKSDLGRRICVEFDGVFRDSIVWINGHWLGRHQSGYTSFSYDLTDYLNYGGKNVLAVRVDASMFEGWWYEGAGIYRHVWLVKTAPLHVAKWGTFVTSKLGRSGARVTVRTTIVNETDAAAVFNLKSEIHRIPGFQPVAPMRKHGLEARATSRRIKLSPWQSLEIVQKLKIKNPKLWTPGNPNLYCLRSVLPNDVYETTFGIRGLRWDAKRGFFLNGKHLKIKGTCNHQNHAGVGVAMPDRLHELRIEKLKELGCNAYRCSHYAATAELLDICDRLGMLVMAENRLAGSSPEVLGQFESMIRRDRNHPSIFLWSIANEEHTIQWSIAGERIGKTMVQLAHRLDPSRKVTAAMHDRGLGEGFANIVDVHGWNYIKVGDIEAFHKRRPDQPIVGSEEASTVCTRGIYADDRQRGYVSAYDIRTPKWGSTAESWWTFFAEREWLAGAFVWTGFDYLGEPIPYAWPCTGSHFGIMDSCGFPKDNYYYYQSWWSDRPVLHILPHWNWRGREAEKIDVRVFSNCEQVELLLNGASLGRQNMKRNSHLAWKVKYEPGTLEARGYSKGNLILTTRRETTGPAIAIALEADRKTLRADEPDLAAITVSTVDAQGRAVPTANNLIEFELAGPARLLGVGNGDPSSHESPKSSRVRLFNGLAQVLIQSTRHRGQVIVTARAKGLGQTHFPLPVIRERARVRALTEHSVPK